MRRRWNSGQIAERRIKVYQLDQARRALASIDTRITNDQRNAGVAFEVGVLHPSAVIPQFESMIAPKDDNGIFGQPGFFQRIHDTTETRIGVALRGSIAVKKSSIQFVGKISRKFAFVVAVLVHLVS